MALLLFLIFLLLLDIAGKYCEMPPSEFNFMLTIGVVAFFGGLFREYKD